ncbi:MAG: hydroxyacid dehydrogenase [Saccharofermentanales bacterium]
MVQTAFFCDNKKIIDQVYAMGRKEQIAGITNLYPTVLTKDNISEHCDNLKELEIVFSTWGMFTLSDEQLEKLPNLKFIFYAASSVQGFARCYLSKGIRVMSAWAANAVPVAEFTLGQILLANKGYFSNLQVSNSFAASSKWDRAGFKGNFHQTIAILGAGMVGKKLVELLKPFKLDVLVYDPYLSDSDAQRLGVKKVSLQEAFAQADVISNHMPDLDATAQILDRILFESMKNYAVFINTGRGRSVVEEDLIAELKKRPSLSALLDVTWPEPPLEGSELYILPNVFLSNHIAGSLGNEVVRMADYCIESFLLWENQQPQKYEITLNILETMA